MPARAGILGLHDAGTQGVELGELGVDAVENGLANPGPAEADLTLGAFYALAGPPA